MKKIDHVEETLRRIASKNKIHLISKDSENMSKRIEEKIEEQRKEERKKRELVKITNIFLSMTSTEIENSMRKSRMEIEKRNGSAREAGLDKEKDISKIIDLDLKKEFNLLSSRELELHYAITRAKIDRKRLEKSKEHI